MHIDIEQNLAKRVKKPLNFVGLFEIWILGILFFQTVSSCIVYRLPDVIFYPCFRSRRRRGLSQQLYRKRKPTSLHSHHQGAATRQTRQRHCGPLPSASSTGTASVYWTRQNNRTACEHILICCKNLLGRLYAIYVTVNNIYHNICTKHVLKC